VLASAVRRDTAGSPRGDGVRDIVPPDSSYIVVQSSVRIAPHYIDPRASGRNALNHKMISFGTSIARRMGTHAMVACGDKWSRK